VRFETSVSPCAPMFVALDHRLLLGSLKDVHVYVEAPLPISHVNVVLLPAPTEVGYAEKVGISAPVPPGGQGLGVGVGV